MKIEGIPEHSQPPRAAPPRGAVTKKRKPTRGRAYGILNPWGDLWTHQTFQWHDDAARYLERYWRGFSEAKRPDLATFKIVPVRVTVSISPEAELPERCFNGLAERSEAAQVES